MRLLRGFCGLIFLFLVSCQGDATTQITEAEVDAAISQSDDYAIHRQAFIRATTQLINEKATTAAEMKEMGGWMKSQNHKDQPVYFTYCGGMTTNNRMYLDVSTDKIFR